MSSETNEAHTVPASQADGRLTRTLVRWLMRPAVIASVDELSDRFRLISFEGEGLRAAAWRPGQKIQVKVGGGLTARTYTPISWDAAAGAASILVWLRGEGPGSAWVRSLTPGQACQFLGPRASLDIADLKPPFVLFGDETSFGLASSVAGLRPQDATSAFLFEVTSADECAPVLERLGVEAALIERRAGDAHLAAIETQIERHAGAADVRFVLTGKAQSIQRVSRALKAAGVGSARILAKAYWAPGKAGLD
ncbi:NADPH-dependent ferric siderophore reductase [Rhodoblastus acidophilus]|uniref:siderophore-interacting protein n=1 Tax=Rhodoblastus acidophilus TaxID=1074 RepID=UPI0022254A29|nr:siderophore-interacting protein [Rhodoblastus acidophilus]MCW2318607.1 NADPH-dependent ferric siderophore reductase [Rhodoblastus acidophilus]